MEFGFNSKIYYFNGDFNHGAAFIEVILKDLLKVPKDLNNNITICF